MIKYRSFCIACLLMISLSAYTQVDSVKYWKEKAKVSITIADRATEAARRAKIEVDRLRYLSIADGISVRSQELKDKELAALLAVQAYNFNLQHRGYECNSNVYGGLVTALKRYDSLPLKLNNPQASS